MSAVVALAILESGGRLEPARYEPRALRDDVRIDIAFAGICHSDIHVVREGWHAALVPLVPGHEITGVVREAGPAVTRFRVGDRVGVGCRVDSCGTCEFCLTGNEQFCGGLGHVAVKIAVDGRRGDGGLPLGGEAGGRAGARRG